jgi:hypothetical protein
LQDRVELNQSPQPNHQTSLAAPETLIVSPERIESLQEDHASVNLAQEKGRDES